MEMLTEMPERCGRLVLIPHRGKQVLWGVHVPIQVHGPFMAVGIWLSVLSR